MVQYEKHMQDQTQKPIRKAEEHMVEKLADIDRKLASERVERDQLFHMMTALLFVALALVMLHDFARFRSELRSLAIWQGVIANLNTSATAPSSGSIAMTGCFPGAPVAGVVTADGWKALDIQEFGLRYPEGWRVEERRSVFGTGKQYVFSTPDRKFRAVFSVSYLANGIYQSENPERTLAYELYSNTWWHVPKQWDPAALVRCSEGPSGYTRAQAFPIYSGGTASSPVFYVVMRDLESEHRVVPTIIEVTIERAEATDEEVAASLKVLEAILEGVESK